MNRSDTQADSHREKFYGQHPKDDFWSSSYFFFIVVVALYLAFVFLICIVYKLVTRRRETTSTEQDTEEQQFIISLPADQKELLNEMGKSRLVEAYTREQIKGMIVHGKQCEQPSQSELRKMKGLQPFTEIDIVQGIPIK